MKDFFRLIACLVMVLSVSSQSWGNEIGRRLFDGFVEETNPEWGR